MKLRKVQILAAFGVLTVMSGGASLAWACSPQPKALELSPNSGGVGDTVEVTGSRFSGRVEVRWQSADGPLLGRASTPDFTLSVTIPAVPKGVYTVAAIVRDENGDIAQKSAAAFQVTRSDVVDEVPDDREPTQPPEQNPDLGPIDPIESPDDTATAPPPAIDPGTDPGLVTPAEPIEPVSEAPASPAPRLDADPAPAVDRSPDPAPVAPQRRPAVPAPAAAPTPDPAPAPVAVDAGDSVAAVSGDLWNGFASGPGSLTGAEPFGTGAPTTDNTGMKAGVALLVAGLAALGLAGTGAAVARRRAVATGDSDVRNDI